MELPDINRTLHRHRRAWYWPWRCRCGRRHTCPARLVAEEALVHIAAREAVDWYPRYFAGRRRTGGTS